MVDTIVDKSYKDFLELISYLEEKNEVSLKNEADNNFKKVLMLTAASFFETVITDKIKDFVDKKSNSNKSIISFTSKKAIERQYHTYFDWDKKNVNSFLGLFGEEFKEDFSKIIGEDEDLEKGIKNFLEIGRVRNELVHKNFGIYTIDVNAKDVYEKYKSAIYFIEIFQNKLI